MKERLSPGGFDDRRNQTTICRKSSVDDLEIADVQLNAVTTVRLLGGHRPTRELERRLWFNQRDHTEGYNRLVFLTATSPGPS